MADELTNESQNEDTIPASEGSATAGSEPVVSEPAVSEPMAAEAEGEAAAASPVHGIRPDASAAPETESTPAETPYGHSPGRRPQSSRGGRGQRDYRDALEGSGLEEVVVKVYRCATVVKGGRRFSFAALVVVGDRQSRVGVGYGKANEVPNAVEKGRKAAQQNMINIKLAGTTIPHRVMAKYRASKVVLLPAGQGTGVIAGASVRAVMELAGIKDVLTKVHGSTGPKNLVKAAFKGLASLRSKEEVAKLRGVSLA